MVNVKNLYQVVDDIIADMKSTCFSDNSIAVYRCAFKRMLSIADERGDYTYTVGVKDKFLNEAVYLSDGRLCDSRRKLHNRCDRIVTSYISTGMMEWGSHPKRKDYSLSSEAMSQALIVFEQAVSDKKLKEGTLAAYKSFVHSFLCFMEKKDVSSPSQIKTGDVTDFIIFTCENRMETGSLRAGLPGLRLFLSINNLDSLMVEIPVHLPRKQDILEVYTDEEYDALDKFLESSNLTYRNRAIGIIALDTGLRSVDILGLKKSDIDWNHENIHVVQEKTEYAFDVPLTNRIGNALVDYLLKERPKSDSEYIFLCERTPHRPMSSSQGCRKVLSRIIKGAGIDCKNRPIGTRMTRHSTASRMVRREVPLYIVSDALGHKNPESVLVYLSTDDHMMSKCTLDLPNIKGGSI
ncbi:MAG: tyrosine-type recombinase/integrase [Dorea sp.]|nr:tyrosine-type recombinase/integrase [Dorea sp.]